MATQEQIHAALMLPDVCHFVDEETLIGQAFAAKILTEKRPLGMKVYRSPRGHDGSPWLKGEEFAVGKANLIAIDGVVENRFRKLALGGG